VFAAAVSRSVLQGVCKTRWFLQGVRLIQQESWYSIDFIFCRFLLICQLEGLNLTFTLKWFFLLKYCRTVSETVWEQVFRVFLRLDLQTCFHGFLIYGLLIFLEILEIYFLLVVQSKRRFNLSILLKDFSKFT